MQKLFAILLVMVIVCAFTACSQPSPTQQLVPEQTVTFADPVLEVMVRAAMGKPKGDITVAEAEAVTALDLSFEWQRLLPDAVPIRELRGLECFKNLESLDFSFHDITDLLPLAELDKLVSLSLSGNPVSDIAPLAGLTNLNVLTLDHSAVSDLSPLSALTNLKHLYLAGCPVLDYSPLANIYPGLISKDFKIMSTLKDLGFIMDENNKTACYDSENASVTVNHSEWGTPPMEMEANSIRMRMQFDGGWIVVGYHAEIQTYVFGVDPNGGGHIDYIYDVPKDSLMCTDRESVEETVLAVLGEAGAENVLLAPIEIFNERIRATFNMTADALYALPFEQTEAEPEQPASPYALPYERLGFTACADNASCRYEQTEPHFMYIAIHRPEWGVSPEGWNIEFHDSDVNGYYLVMQYFADEDKWSVRMEKGGADCSFDVCPSTDDKGSEYPDIETVHRMVGDAFDSQGKELYYKPLIYFEQVVQDHFGMSVEELYALPKQ